MNSKFFTFFFVLTFLVAMTIIFGQFVVMGYAVTHAGELTSSAAYEVCKLRAASMGDLEGLKKCEDVKPKQ